MAAAPPEQAVPHRAIITSALMIATLMQALDSTIANVALPYMQGSLSATSDQITWVLTSYITAAAIMTAPVGWLAARFGRKRFFIALPGRLHRRLDAVRHRAVARPRWCCSACCRACSAPRWCRCRRATMLDIYPPEQRGSAMAIWGMGVMVGPILGPTLGGYLTDLYNWRWVFYVNLPFGIAAVTGLALFMPKTRRAIGHAVRLRRASACWRSASARCSSCWTAGRTRTGSARPRSSSRRCWPGSASICSSSTC